MDDKKRVPVFSTSPGHQGIRASGLPAHTAKLSASELTIGTPEQYDVTLNTIREKQSISQTAEFED